MQPALQIDLLRHEKVKIVGNLAYRKLGMHFLYLFFGEQVDTGAGDSVLPVDAGKRVDENGTVRCVALHLEITQ